MQQRNLLRPRAAGTTALPRIRAAAWNTQAVSAFQLELTDSVRKALLEELRPVVREIVEQVLLEHRYKATATGYPGRSQSRRRGSGSVASAGS